MHKKRMSRIDLKVDIVINYRGKSVKGKLINLSLNGLLLMLDEIISVDLNEKVELCIKENEDINNQTIELECSVVRMEEKYLGLKFEAVDINSFNIIKGTIIRAVGDEESIMTEFFEFLVNEE
jgi:c-di-GMP-binding flagellar brake protein YcgR